jgi:hypothetical protein
LLTRVVLPLALLGVALALTGCEQVAVIRSAPVSASFDGKHGNNPVAAADGASLEQALKLRSQVWSISIAATPAAGGYVDVKDPAAVRTARGSFTQLTLTLVATAQATLEGFSSRGPSGEQAYCEALLQAIATAGYTKLSTIHVEVHFNSSHHATLAWQASTGFTYTVLDGKP